jgi:hypothetical protein
MLQPDEQWKSGCLVRRNTDAGKGDALAHSVLEKNTFMAVTNRSPRHRWTSSLSVALLLAALSSSKAAASTEHPINCSSISAPSAGAWWVSYDAMDWWFDLTATRTGTSGSQEVLSFTPLIATSQNEHQFQKLVWSTPGGYYDCFQRETQLGGGNVQVDWVHRSSWTTGNFNYVYNGEDCQENYTDAYDPYNEEPPSNCPMSGSAGDSEDTESEVTQTGNWSSLCGDFDLAPGSYDVYVDGYYQETISC